MIQKRTKLVVGNAFFILCTVLVLALPAVALPMVTSPATESPSISTTADKTASPSIDSSNRGSNKYLAPPRLLAPEGMQSEDVLQRPFLYWRSWINQCLPFRCMLVFLLFVSTGLQFLCGPKLLDAKEHYQRKWLRSLGLGVLSTTFGSLAVVSLARLAIFTPLATVVLAAVQLLCLMGLVVAAASVGQSVSRLLRLERWLRLPWLKIFVPLWIGVFLLSLLILIPGVGLVPRIGNRILALIAVTGAGALLASWQKDSERQD